MTRDNLLDAMRKMRSLVEPEGPAPDAETVDWAVPHRFHREAVEAMGLFSAKLAGHLEKSLHLISGLAFEVTAEGVHERYAERLFTQVIQEQPQNYYLPLTLSGKGQVGFISMPFETAAILVGCMLRDPEAGIGKDEQMSALAESILLDAAAALAEAIAAGFGEYGRTTLEKADRLVYLDWPVRFKGLEDLCQFEFKAVREKTTLTLTLTVLDEMIADIARLEGPFGRTEEKKENPERITKRMHGTPMRVAALLSSALMTLNDILTLEEGDVVMLDRKITEPIDVMVNGKLCFCGWPAMQAGRRAVLVADEKSRLP